MASLKRKIFLGLILFIFLDFIIIVLEPFDTDQFEADHRFLLLSGYGFLVFVVFVIQSCVENRWYSRVGKVWLASHELFSTIIFCLFSGTVLYLYNTWIVNLASCSIGTFAHFICITVAGMVPVFVPPMLYLRQKLGERIVPSSSSSSSLILLMGENKNEILNLEKEDLLYVKAVENYIEICYVDQDKSIRSKTFRQTLSNVCEQLPFLEKCHRSYLVNTNAIALISGNSQSAKISFRVGEKEIPLSKTYYKHIKDRVF